ncbi:MAG: hypothetical protein WCJ99_12520 [Betaproteobacteria bacterium]
MYEASSVAALALFFLYFNGSKKHDGHTPANGWRLASQGLEALGTGARVTQV